ncbi:MAG: class I tRNA ligase family protein [Thermoplasmata archaeon]
MPPAAGILGTGGGPMICQLLPGLRPGETPIVALQAAVLADVEARYLALAGRRSGASIRPISTTDESWLARLRQTRVDLGVWVGAAKDDSFDLVDRHAEIQSMVNRLASARVLITRDVPFRTCPACREPRTPEAIVYQEEEGPAYLVRFPLANTNPPVAVLVWIDVPWKLIGTSALLLNPTLPYVVARLRQGGREEQVMTSRSSLTLLKATLRNVEIEVLEEHPGSTWNGKAYVHPLANEVPTLNQLSPPAGTLIGTLEITDTGTGIVGLIPAHGGTDAEVAQALHVPGWPVVSSTGILDRILAHKYAGLELDIGAEFILRDLQESGSLLTEIRVRRGVPHCGFCGTALVWQPARAWCLQPSRLDREWIELYHRLLPDDPSLESLEVAPWPVSLSHSTEDPGGTVLLECDQCDRLQPVGAGPTCACGGRLFPVRRHLLPIVATTFGAVAHFQPFAPGDSVHFYVGDRRRSPLLAHQIVALAALPAKLGDTRLTRVPTLPAIEPGASPARDSSGDALRAGLVRMDHPVGRESVFRDQCAQELRRLRKLWAVVQRVSELMRRDGFAPDSAPISASLSELEEEDRAILSVFERRRIEVLRAYENGEFSKVHRLLQRFLEHDLRENYLPLIRRRLAGPGLSPAKSSLYRTLAYIFVQWTVLYGPIAPYTTETVYRLLRGEGQSLFEGRFAPLQQSLLDAELERSFDRWGSVIRALDRYRKELGTPPDELLPLVVLAVSEEAFGAELKEGVDALRRLAGVREIQLATPDAPWEGRRIEVRPVETEIQRAYPRRASQIIHILRQMPGRRIQDGLRAGTLSIVLDGQRETIGPSMVELTEKIDDSMTAVPWSLGELYVRTARSTKEAPGKSRPALTPDEFALLRSIRRALTKRPSTAPLDQVRIAASGHLLEHLTQHARAIAEYLGISRVEVIPYLDQLPSAGSVLGRTARGESWGFYLPGGVPQVARRAPRARVIRRSRLRLVKAPAGAALAAVDFLDESIRVREETIRGWVPQLDARLGAPLLGPAKLTTLWNSGIHDLETLARTPYDQLRSLPGFGPVVAATVVQKLGGTPPDRVVRQWLSEVEASDRAATIVAAAVATPSGGAQLTGPMESEPPPVAPEAVSYTQSPAPTRPRPPRARTARIAPAEVVDPDIMAPVGPPGPMENPRPDGSRGAPVGPPRPSTRTRRPPSPAVTPPSETPAVPPATPDIQAAAPTRPDLELVAAVPLPPPAPPPPPAGVELWLGRSSAVPLSHFLEATGAGHRGLCITREFPDRLRAYVGTRDVNVVWLTNIGRGTTIKPTDLGGIVTLIQTALREQQVTAIFLEGIEYLVRLHTADRIVAVLLEIDAEARPKDVRLWIPVHPELIPAADLDRLRSGLPRTLTSD